jgi:hypothetical protein
MQTILENASVGINGPLDLRFFKANHTYFLEHEDLKKCNTLTAKIIGPNLAFIKAAGFPVSDYHLKTKAHLLVIGDHWAGYEDIESIYDTILEYINKYSIQNLNILITAHGLLKNDGYQLGLSYEPNGYMGEARYVAADILTQQLINLTQHVSSTNIASISCYGKNLLAYDGILEAKNTIFCFLSDKEVTRAEDFVIFGERSDLLETTAEKHKFNFLQNFLINYGVNFKVKNHIPSVTHIHKGKQTEYSYIIPEDIQEILNNEFVQISLMKSDQEGQIAFEIQGAKSENFIDENVDSNLSKDALRVLVIYNVQKMAKWSFDLNEQIENHDANQEQHYEVELSKELGESQDHFEQI